MSGNCPLNELQSPPLMKRPFLKGIVLKRGRNVGEGARTALGEGLTSLSQNLCLLGVLPQSSLPLHLDPRSPFVTGPNANKTHLTWFVFSTAVRGWHLKWKEKKIYYFRSKNKITEKKQTPRSKHTHKGGKGIVYVCVYLTSNYVNSQTYTKVKRRI